MVNEVALKIYPRGFLGKPLEAQLKAKPRSIASQLSSIAVKVNLFTPQVNSVDANPLVETLYGKWINRAPETTSFEFRKQVFIAALDAFGTDSFFHWYGAQMYSPSYGDMHRRFLEDTLLFLQEGRRTMSLETWAALVTIQDSGERVADLSDCAKEFFGVKVPDAQYRQPQNREIPEIIQRWVSHPRGFDDLVGSIHLLFGNLT
jgi:hypothetical protein